MSAFAIRRATPADAELLAHHRAAVWEEVGDWSRADLAPQIPVWTAYFRDAMTDGFSVAWIVETDGETVGSGAVLVHRAIPRPGYPGDQEGRVLSIYVSADALRRGIALAVLDEIRAYARAAQLIRLTLHPSDEGRPLYASLGFAPLDEMGLRLSDA